MHGLTAVAAVAAPVVEHVVPHVHALVQLGGVTRTQTGHAALMVNHQAVVIRRAAASPVAAVAVGTLGVAGITQTLGDQTPLHGDALTSSHG